MNVGYEMSSHGQQLRMIKVEDKPPYDEENEHSFFYRMRYNEEHSRFEHGFPPANFVPSKSGDNGDDDLEACTICPTELKMKKLEKAEVGGFDRIDDECDEKGNYQFRCCKYLGKTYKLDEAIFVSPPPAKDSNKEAGANALEKKKSEVDEDRYPEFYRKTTTIRGSNECTAKPFGIGIIEEIFSPERRGKKKVTLKVNSCENVCHVRVT